MCRICKQAATADLSLDDLLTAAKIHGFILYPVNSKREYAVGWDGRPVARSDSREVAQAGVDKALEEGQVGRWSLLQRRLGPWEEATDDKPLVGSEFWEAQT